jgi:hypothetical protein
MKNFNFGIITNEFCKPDSVVTITINGECFLFDVSSKGLTNREGDLPSYLDNVELDDEEKLIITGVDLIE